MVDSKLFDFFRKIKQPSIVSDDSQTNSGFMIVGLGNPGKDYQKNRHNIGFMAIDKIANKFNFEGKKVKSKAIVLEGKKSGRKIILVKPQTFMNLSGMAVASLVHFYKIHPNNLIVIHDDLDLPSLSIRIRPGGGAGGQKGVASIIQHLGTQNFNRIRIGIGRPPGRMDASAYVLQNFSRQEEEELVILLDTVARAVECILDDGIETAMNKFNSENGGDK
jgi:PTH1 family peptidyl-tRNA hydrolase